jgi:hypothetical protein
VGAGAEDGEEDGGEGEEEEAADLAAAFGLFRGIGGGWEGWHGSDSQYTSL